MSELKPCPMTADEAITVLERLAHTESKWPGTEDTLEALDVAVEALRRAQSSNEPLTLEELREMCGEPVYIKYHTCGRWEIYQGFMHDHGLYGKTWLAYRRPPERSENDV